MTNLNLILFRSYRPVGDVCIKNSNYEEGTDATKCRPSEMSYEGEIFESITGSGTKGETPSGNTPYPVIITMDIYIHYLFQVIQNLQKITHL